MNKITNLISKSGTGSSNYHSLFDGKEPIELSLIMKVDYATD